MKRVTCLAWAQSVSSSGSWQKTRLTSDGPNKENERRNCSRDLGRQKVSQGRGATQRLEAGQAIAAGGLKETQATLSQVRPEPQQGLEAWRMQ